MTHPMVERIARDLRVLASVLLLGSTTLAAAEPVDLSSGPAVTPRDVAQFDALWMGAAGGRLNYYDDALKNRQGWVQWGLIEDAIAMVRLYELTRDTRYLDHLKGIAERTLRYRDDNHTGDDHPNGDNPDCMVCRPPFVDYERGGVQHAWGTGLYSDFASNGGLNPVDAVTSGNYAYPMVAFARLVAEDADRQAVYGAAAVTFANAGIQMLQSFASQFDFRTTRMGDVEGTVERPEVFPTKSQCQNAQNAAKAHLDLYPPKDENGNVSQETKKYYMSQITKGKKACDNQGDYAGRPWTYNEGGALMSAFIELWRVLDSGFYRAHAMRSADAPPVRTLIPFVVARHQRYLFNRLRSKNDLPAEGVRYEWNYNDDVPDPRVEDTVHGNLDIQYISVLRGAAGRFDAVTAPAGEPIALDDAVARRFANTFLEKIARPDKIDAGGHLGCNVDGSGGCKYEDPWASDAATFGWVNLSAVDPTLFRIVRDVALRMSKRPTDDEPNPPPRQNDLTIANHAGLLANKRYSRDVIASDLTLLSLSEDAATDSGVPFGWVFAGGDVQAVTYRGADGHVYEIWRTVGGGIGHTNLSANAGAPRAKGNPKGYEFPALGTHNVVYVGTDGHLHALFWTTGAVSHKDLTVLSRASPPAGDPFPYVSPQYGVQNVIYRGTDGHLHELYWSSGDVGHSDLTRLTGAPGPVGDPHGFFITTEGVQNIFYRGVDGHLHGLYWATGGVSHEDLTQLSNAPPPSGNPVAYVTPAGFRIVFFRGTDGRLHSIYWENGVIGHDNLSLNAVDGAPLPAGDPEAYFNPQDNTHHVIYRTSNGHLHELSFGMTGAVAHADLTTLTPVLPSDSKASGYVFPSDRTQHAVYRKGKRIFDLAWSTMAVGGQSDLLPLPISGAGGPTAFCRLNELKTALRIVVANQGPANSGASTTRVTFTTTSGPLAVDLAMPALGGLGQSATVELTLPQSCISTVPTYCDFHIDADIGNSVTESDETNNHAMGSCPPIL